MSILDVKDRIPTNVLDNKAVRYGVYDESGNLLRYEYMKREDEPIEEGTPINKVLFDNIYGMDNYELLTVEQENLSEQLTAETVNLELEEAESGEETWYGHMNGKQDQEPWVFRIYGNGRVLRRSASININDTSVYGSYNGSSTTNLNEMNEILGRTSYNSNYYIELKSNAKATPYFYWDMLKPCTPTFNFRSPGSKNTTIGNFQGSNDGSNWSNISSVSGTELKVITPTTAYRYYKLPLTFMSTSEAYFRIGLMYFSNVPDVIRNYHNNFTVDHDFNIKEHLNAITPSFENADYITENNINGVPLEQILLPNQGYRLRYDGEKIIRTTRVVTGTFTATKTLQTIDLGFKPDLVIVYSKPNNYTTPTNYDGNATFKVVPRILTKAYYYTESSCIVKNGFTYKIYDETDEVAMYYIAIKF